VEKVEAAAKAGDILAQSTLGSACLQGGEQLPKDVTNALYWFQEVANRADREFLTIRPRLKSILEQRQLATNPKKQRKLELEYLDLLAKKLAFEQAYVGLIQIYFGGQGRSYANPALALKCMQQGADYGIAPAQRILGIANLHGLFGVPKNVREGLRLLHAAAAQGDHAAEDLLRDLYASGMTLPTDANAARY
jgi:TPR repeat protein